MSDFFFNPDTGLVRVQLQHHVILFDWMPWNFWMHTLSLRKKL